MTRRFTAIALTLVASSAFATGLTVKGPISPALLPLLIRYMDCLQQPAEDPVQQCSTVRSEVTAAAPGVVRGNGAGGGELQELRRFELNLAKADASATKLAAKKARRGK